MDQILPLVQFSFEPVNIFEKMLNVRTAPKKMYSRKQSWVIVTKRTPDAPPGNICSNIQIDSTKINYQGKLFVHLTE